MFAPTFLFGVICRYLPSYSWCPPGVTELAASCPSFLTGDLGLCVFGVLGVLEVVANWDDTVRELLSETNIETYAKPVFAALVSYSICTPEQMQVLSAVVEGIPGVMPVACDSATVESVTNAVVSAAPAEVSSASGISFSAIASSLFCGGGTFGLCKVRAGIVAAVRELDSDNSLHLNTLLTLFEEGSWLAVLPVVLVFPVLALILMIVLAFCGWVLPVPLRRIAERRRAHWDAVGREGMLKAVRTRAIIIFVIGVFLCTIPVIGYLATVIALNLFVFRVISLYEKPVYRVLVRIIMRFIKLTLLLVAIVFSSIPFMGILLMLPYFVSYMMRIEKVRNAGASVKMHSLETRHGLAPRVR